MPKLHEVITGARDCEILIGGQVIQVTYDPNAYTPEAEAVWKTQNWAGELAVDFLCQLIKFWNIEEDESEEYVKLTVERVSKLPLPLLSDIMAGIFQDISTGPKAPSTRIAPNRQARRARSQKRPA